MTHCKCCYTLNPLQRSATRCSTLQQTAPHCSTALHQTAPLCTTLHHTATLCNSVFREKKPTQLDVAHTLLEQHCLIWHTLQLQHTATHCSTLQHTAAHCSTLQHTAAHCSILQHFIWHRTNTPTGENDDNAGCSEHATRSSDPNSRPT